MRLRHRKAARQIPLLSRHVLYAELSVLNPHMSSDTFLLPKKKKKGMHQGATEDMQMEEIRKHIYDRVSHHELALDLKLTLMGPFLTSFSHHRLSSSAADTGPHAPTVAPAKYEEQENGCLKSRSD